MTELSKPGTSPFHVRGSTYLHLREQIEQAVPGGLDAVLRRLPDDEHRAFARQVFLPVAWYDSLPVLPFTQAIADVAGLDYAESVRARARVVAESDASGLYKLLLKVPSPEAVIERMQRALLRYFNFGRIEVLSTRRGRSEGRLLGLPRPLLPWFTPMIEGYASSLLAMAGAGAPRIRFDPPVHEGERMGIETVSLRCHFSWMI